MGELEEEDGGDYATEEDPLGFQVVVGGFLVDCY